MGGIFAEFVGQSAPFTESVDHLKFTKSNLNATEVLLTAALRKGFVRVRATCPTMLDDNRRFSFVYRAFADLNGVIRKSHLRVARWGLTVCVLLPRIAVFRHVLLVEPDAVFGSHLQVAVSDVAEVRCVSHFAAARSVLQQSPVNILVTNLRLGAFNGLHLVYLAQFLARGARAVVYTDWLDTGLGRDVQRAGAFYETRPCLPYTLVSYLDAVLPPKDGRNLAIHDRRQMFRGGRRSADRLAFHGLRSSEARIM